MIEANGPRPPSPRRLLGEAQIRAMTRRALLDVVLPACEHYQQSPRWPHLTPKQEAEYEAWFGILRTYFRPGDLIGATLTYVQGGGNTWWDEPATPVALHRPAGRR